MLTVGQQSAFDEVINLLIGGHKKIRLVGSAGTGKTYLVSELVKYFCKDRSINPNFNNGQVYVTAPTNKALSILQSKIDAPVEFKTIHSALKMHRVTNPKSGQKYFVRSKSRSNEFNFAKICVIDECSMLNSEFVGGNENVTEPYLDEFPFPIIFVGDDKQLNPIKEACSPVFVQDYPEVRLTEIIRQGEGNPIIDLSRDLALIYFKKPVMVNGSGYTYSDNKDAIISDLAEVNGTDELKYLGYTNVVIDSINQTVRERRYKNPKKIEKDETLVFNSPFGNFFTNQEIKVEDLSVIIADVVIPTEFTRYDRDGAIGAVDKIKMKYYRINDKINIVHENSEAMYTVILRSIAEKCSKEGWDYRGKDLFVEQFADIKYNHAITVHKSQGSTYKDTIINIGNIGFCRNAQEKERMLYTAVTRASNLVILNNVK